MDGPEIIHVLVDEFGYGNLSEIAVGLVPDEPHREDVAECGGDQGGMLANQQF